MSSKNPEPCYQAWDELRGQIRSRKGGWRIGKGAFTHGLSIMDDLVGRHSYFSLIILNALDYLPEKKLADWLEAFYMCMSWPDPRIWCNQVGALGGAARTSAVTATVAGILAADSHMYGIRPLTDGVTFIQKALALQQDGLSAEDIVANEIKRHRGKVMIMGYARPIASGDERIPALERVARSLGFEIGEHLMLAYQIEKILWRDHQESMNVNGYASAFLSDQGMSAQDVYHVSATLVASGVTACYLDSYERPADTFLPLRCEDIDYQGKPPRPVPDP